MAFNYRENNSGYIICLIEFTEKNNKTNFRKIFTSSVSFINFQFLVLEGIVDMDDLRCQLVCNIGDLLREPTEQGSVGIWTGSFCDFWSSIRLKVTVTNINE